MVDEKPNFMTADWCGISAATPSAISVAIRPARYTLESTNAIGTFSINLASADPAQLGKIIGKAFFIGKDLG